MTRAFGEEKDGSDGASGAEVGASAGRRARTAALTGNRGGAGARDDAAALRDPLPPWDGPSLEGAGDPFGLHLEQAGAAGGHTTAGPATKAGGTFGPLTEIAAAAQEVSDAAVVVLVAHQRGHFSDGGVVALNGALAALGDVLHRHAGARIDSDERAFRAALRDALAVADQLGRFGHRNEHEVALRKRVAMIDRLATGAAEAPARLALEPGEMVAQVERSMRQLARAREQAARWPVVDEQELARAIEKTAGWQAQLTGPNADAASAKLSLAVSEQQELLFVAAGELDLVIAGPELPTTGHVVAAYVHAMARSTDANGLGKKSLERARTERRRQAIHVAADILDEDRQTALMLGEVDAGAGQAARGEQAAVERRREQLDKRLVAGDDVDRLLLDELLVDAREVAFLHRMQLFEGQLEQLARALGSANSGAVAWVANRFETDIHRLPGELRDFARVPAAFRASYKERVAAAKDAMDSGEYVSPRRERERMLAARGKALDTLEDLARGWLAQGELERKLRNAESELEDAQVRLIATNILATVALTLAGNFAASAARGAAEGTVMARATAAGASAVDAARTARIVGGAAGLAADVAVNTAGQKLLLGDQASLVTLLTLNVASPLVLGKIQKRFRALDAAHARGSANASLWERAARGKDWALRRGAEMSIEMVAGAALDYAVRRAYDEKAVALTDEDAQTWLLQGAAMGLGRFVAGRTADLGDRIQRTTRDEAHFLHGRARELQRLAGDVERTGDVDAAADMLGRYKDLLDAEHDFLDAELAKHADGTGEIDVDLLATAIRSNNRAGAALSKLGFEELALRGGGLTPANAGGTAWEGTSAQVATMLGHARKLGLDVATADYDPVGRRWRVTLGDRSFEVAELGPAPVDGPSLAAKLAALKHVDDPAKVAESLKNDEAFARRKAENEALIADPERLQQDLDKAGVSMERFRLMHDGDPERSGARLPLGFESWDQFDAFRADFAAVMDGIVIDGRPVSGVAKQIGTSTGFYSGNPKKPLGHHFDRLAPKDLGDIDIELSSPELVKHMLGLDPVLNEKVMIGGEMVIFKNGGDVGTGFHTAFPKFRAFSVRWSARLGREVDVKLKADLTPSAAIPVSTSGPIELYRKEAPQ